MPTITVKMVEVATFVITQDELDKLNSGEIDIMEWMNADYSQDDDSTNWDSFGGFRWDVLHDTDSRLTFEENMEEDL